MVYLILVNVFLNSVAMQLQDVFKLIKDSVDPVSDTGRTRKTTGLCGFADIEDALRRTQFPGRGRWRRRRADEL